MAKFEVTEGAELSAEMIAALKPFMAAGDDGKLYLDTDQLKTADDVANVLRAKENANTELRKVKADLADAQSKLKTYSDAFGDDPTVTSAELEELRKGSGGIQQRLIEATQNAKQWEKKFNDQQPEFERLQAVAEKQKQQEYSENLDKVWNKKKKDLDPKWSKAKADVIFRNYKSNVRLDDDDPEDFARLSDGRTVMEYMTEQLDLIGAYENISGGKSNPGNGDPVNGKSGDMFSNAASQLNF